MERRGRISLGIALMVGTLGAVACSSSPSGHLSAGGTHTLFFRPVLCEIPAFAAGSSPATVPTGSIQSVCSDPSASRVPDTRTAVESASQDVVVPYYVPGGPRYVLGPADLSGSVITHARVIVDAAGQYEIQLTFSPTGAAAFDRIAAQRYPYYAQNPNNPPYQALEAVELDRAVVTAPTIQARSFNGSAVISGSTSAPFSKSQALSIASDIEAAARA